ncbi:MAG: galactokinase [Planctomycetes bacterium]|nr:galactokinase [Planctomycetota bacterium]
MPQSAPDPVLDEQVARAAARFTRQFGRSPRFAAAAPGRVNLIGEHTDYNDGFVLPMAIQRQTVIVAGPTPEPSRSVRLMSANSGGDKPVIFSLAHPVTRAGAADPWSNYVRGVIAGCLAAGLDPGGFDAVIDSTVPLGGGLSSSASLEVAAATLMEAMTGKTLPPMDKARLCQAAEHNYAGVPCGIMDQAIAVLAQPEHAMLLDCRSFAPRMVPLADPNVSVLIANTNVKHELTGGEYAQRRAECESAARAAGVKSLRDLPMKALLGAKGKMTQDEYRRAYHVVGEIARTQQAAEAALAGDWTAFGRLMHKSHASLRDDFEVSCAELDLMVELAGEAGKTTGGVFGSRMTGGGFGGCTVTLVRTDAADRVAQYMHDQYKKRTSIEPTLFVTRPAPGARAITLV